jgi:hypothetical protein
VNRCRDKHFFIAFGCEPAPLAAREKAIGNAAKAHALRDNRFATAVATESLPPAALSKSGAHVLACFAPPAEKATARQDQTGKSGTRR